jgi:MazG family protein
VIRVLKMDWQKGRLEMPGSDELTLARSWLRFLSVVAKLRGEGGCPWDKEQTYISLTPFVIEEAYEVVVAALEKDANKLKEELGDLLLEIGLYCQIAREAGDFEPSDVLEGIIAKLIRRHPHVFGEEKITSPEGVRERWAEIKRSEPGRYQEGHSLMDEVPKGLPALMRAQKQQMLAAEAGFDWKSEAPVLDKVREEIEELATAMERGNTQEIEDEVGDLLFACVNLARHLGVDSETALLGCVEKFSQRFRHIEDSLRQRNLTVNDVDLEYLDELWEQAKSNEAKAD